MVGNLCSHIASQRVPLRVEIVRVIPHSTIHVQEAIPVVLLVVVLDIGAEIQNVQSRPRPCEKPRPEKDAEKAKERLHVPSLQQ